MDIIESYEKDLQVLRQQHRLIARKKVKEVHKILGKEKVTWNDQRTPAERRSQALLSSMITSTEFSLYWLKNGHQRRAGMTAGKSIPKYLREQLWGDVDDCIKYRGTKDQYRLASEDERRNEVRDLKKELMMDQLEEILSLLSDREKQLFILKHTAMLSDQECAAKMELAPGTIKSMQQRIRNKIDRYFEYGHQMSLF